MLRRLSFYIGRNRIGIDSHQFPLRLNAAPPKKLPGAMAGQVWGRFRGN